MKLAEPLPVAADERQELRKLRLETCALLGVVRAVASYRDRDGVFRSIAEILRELLGFCMMEILVSRPDGGDRETDQFVTFVYEREGAHGAFKVGRTFPQANTAAGWVIERQRPFVGSTLEDLDPFPDSRQALEEDGVRSNCILPLVVDSRAIGVLIFLSKKPHRFDDVDLDLVSEIAEAIAIAVDNCLAWDEISRLESALRRENLYLQEEIKTQHNFEELVGESEALRKVLRDVETVAPTDANVLITGETGTGKELVARAIHNLSTRQGRPLVKVNCAALAPGLVESELFGHERGAFTGAVNQKIGRFELAHRGTLFLDEISELPLDLQAKLLRVLQEGELERLGSARTRAVDVRVIAATNRDLERALAEGRFRDDLYYRLNVFPVALPPLRERLGDIPLLVRHFVHKAARRLGRRIDTVPRKVLEACERYPWPGNVRELENVIERAVIVSRGPELELRDALPRPAAPRLATLEGMERQYIREVLDRTGWRLAGPGGAAELLGMKRTTLQARMKKLGLRRLHSAS